MTGWVEKVAERAGVTVPEAEKVLRRWGIRPDRAARVAPSLQIKSIVFTGVKQGDEARPFYFQWADLSAGVWALGSYDNFVGKSTVFEITRWMLRGEPKQPKGLSPEIRKGWLRSAEVRFELDEQTYGVILDVQSGSASGALVRWIAGEQEVVDTFGSDAGFAAVMSRFMIVVYNSKDFWYTRVCPEWHFPSNLMFRPAARSTSLSIRHQPRSHWLYGAALSWPQRRGRITNRSLRR